MPTLIVIGLCLWMFARSAAAQPAESALVVGASVAAVVVLTLLTHPRRS